MSMKLFGQASKFVNFTNSKGEQFITNNSGTIWGTPHPTDNTKLVANKIFTPSSYETWSNKDWEDITSFRGQDGRYLDRWR